jgi:hypothetical protein
VFAGTGRNSELALNMSEDVWGGAYYRFQIKSQKECMPEETLLPLKFDKRRLGFLLKWKS